MNNTNKEIEVRFLDIDKTALQQRLVEAGAADLGEETTQELIFYDPELKWMKDDLKLVRLRRSRKKNYLTYKHHAAMTATGVIEIEIEVSDFIKAKQILEAIGLYAYREVEKKRHTFKLGEVIIDIDIWPTVPPLVEFEGPSEESLKEVSAKFGFDWSKAVFEPSIIYLEKYYNIPVEKVRIFTFNKIVKE